MGRVIVDEIRGHPRDVRAAGNASLEFEPPLDQFAGAGADHVTRRGERDGRQPLAIQYEVEGVDQELVLQVSGKVVIKQVRVSVVFKGYPGKVVQGGAQQKQDNQQCQTAPESLI